MTIEAVPPPRTSILAGTGSSAVYFGSAGLGACVGQDTGFAAAVPVIAAISAAVIPDIVRVVADRASTLTAAVAREDSGENGLTTATTATAAVTAVVNAGRRLSTRDLPLLPVLTSPPPRPGVLRPLS
jgi:hypothetical protein